MSAHVTVGYDGTPDSREAVMWAADEAAARQVPVRIVSCQTTVAVGDPFAAYPAAELYDAARTATEGALASLRVAVVTRHPDLDVAAMVSGERPQAALLDAVDGPDDLLVVGASHHHGAAAFWLGSTPRAVARRSPCPVVVVRGTTNRGRPTRVVVGVDGSPDADEALRWAADEAGLHHVELVVVHAWEYPYAEADFGDSQARKLMHADAARVLAAASTRASQQCPTAVREALVEGSTATALLDVADDGDLLVLGSRGRGAVVAGIFGSTVNAVLERATAPVVIVRRRSE